MTSFMMPCALMCGVGSHTVEMCAPLARWHGPGGQPGRGAATGLRAPRGARRGPPPPAIRRPLGARSLGGAAGPVTCGHPEHLI